MKQTMTLAHTIGVGIALVSAQGWAATEEQLEKTFPVKAGGQLVIDVNFGTIEVKGADRPDVHVAVYRKATTRGFLGGNEEKERAELKLNPITFSQEGDVVTVRSRRDKDAPRR